MEMIKRGTNMSNQEKIKAGYWSIATQKHLKVFRQDSSNIDEFDNLDLAGKTGMFLGTIRGNSQIDNMRKIEKMANTVGIRPKELHKIILPELERASDKKVELKKNTIGEIVGIEEYVFTNKEVLEITGNVLENQGPKPNERITIETMDHTKKIPYLENEIKNILITEGFKENDIQLSLALQNQFNLISKLKKSKSNESIISNEYIWGVNHDKIALAVSGIDLGKRQSLKDIIEIIQNSQGYPIEKLPSIDKDLLVLAQKTGMINPTTIISSRGIRKEFGFTPNILNDTGFNDDILDDVKLLLASIRFGENYTSYSTIQEPVRFLESLIKYGDIGPHSANASDYTLLEKKGIVKVVKKTKENWYTGAIKTGYCLELVKKDVAEEALKIIKSPDYNINIQQSELDYEIVNDTGSYLSSEEVRINMGKSPEPVAEAEAYFASVLRDELL